MKLKRKGKIGLIIATIITVTIIIGGSYGFFTSLVTGNDLASSINADTASLSLLYNGTSNIYLHDALPGSSITKTFTVENTGTEAATYDLYWTEITNDFDPTSDLVYTIRSTNNGGKLLETVVPNINGVMIENIAINKETSQTYTLVIYFKETGSNQNTNMGKMFNGKVEVVAQKQGQTTVEGTSPLTLTNSNGSNLLNYKIYGNTMQEGGVTPDTPKEIVSLGDNYLPSEYTQIEYIEGTGSQYINTGITPNATQNLIYEIVVEDLSSTSSSLYGSQISSSKWSGIIHGSKTAKYLYVGSNHFFVGNTSNKTNIKTIIDVQNAKAQLYLNKVLKVDQTYTGTIDNNLSIYLFANNVNNSAAQLNIMKLYYFKIIKDNIVERNMIPCYRNSDNEPGMYDTIYNVFYPSLSSQKFEMSTNKAYAFDIKTKGSNLINFDEITSYSLATEKTNYDGDNVLKRKRSYAGNIWPIFHNSTMSNINLENGKTYTISFYIKSTVNASFANQIFYWNSNISVSHNLRSLTTEWQRLSATINYISSTNTNILHIYPVVGDYDIYIKDIQIEEGNNLNDYESYHYPTTNTIILLEPLRCINDICDYINSKTNQIIRNIQNVKFAGADNENWFLYNNPTEGISFARTFGNAKLKYQTSLATHFVNISGSWNSINKNNYGIYSDHLTIINKYFRAPNSSVTTVTQFRNWLQLENTNNTPVNVAYQLETPSYKNIVLPEIKTNNSRKTIVEVNDGHISSTNIEIDYLNKIP